MESLWDSSQRTGGSGVVDHLAKAPSNFLLAVSLHAYFVSGTTNNMTVFLYSSSYAISITPGPRNQKAC